MIDTLYIEAGVRAHPVTRAVVARHPRATQIACTHYGEVFNNAAQNFRLQKRRPALILARKRQGWVQPAPRGYGIGGEANYYFSHLLNCPYDCRYCFLQGMFRSANYVLFVNFENFGAAMDQVLARRPQGTPAWFFSGYDADSLALEALTGFAGWALDWLARRPSARLELRTKSTRTGVLERRRALPNCVVAFSFTPQDTARCLEHQAPAVARRIAAAARLQSAGWPIGIRLDPLIYTPDYRRRYRALIAQLRDQLDPERLHSVSVGALRTPRDYFARMLRLYPEEALFAGPLEERDGMVGYHADLEAELLATVTAMARELVGAQRLFVHPTGAPA